MVPEGKPRVTEIQLDRIDCNGCVQKIKKALRGINGIYDLYIDLPKQKLTIIGWADPEKIVKAIKKTRKIATICSHSEAADPPAEPQTQPTEPSPDQLIEAVPPAPEAANPPPTEAEPTPQAEPSNNPPPPENPTPQPTVVNEASASQPAQPSRPKDLEEAHVLYPYPPDYGYRYGCGQNYSPSYANGYNGHPNGPGFPHEPPSPVYVTHSYNTYNPSPYVTHSYKAHEPSPNVTEYEYIRSPPQYTHYSRPEHYSDYYYNSNNGNGNITSMFSDENPNACRIV